MACYSRDSRRVEWSALAPMKTPAAPRRLVVPAEQVATRWPPSETSTAEVAPAASARRSADVHPRDAVLAQSALRVELTLRPVPVVSVPAAQEVSAVRPPSVCRRSGVAAGALEPL